MRNAFTICGLVLAAGLLFLAGSCSSEPDRLSPVRGKVFYRESPLPGGTIVFTPDADRGGSGLQARAEIQPDGSYVLRTEQAPGAVPGWHRVTVSLVEAPAQAAGGQRYAVPRSLVPQKYRDPELSGLSYEVKADQANDIDVHLE